MGVDRQARQDREAGAKWVRDLSMTQVSELGDAFVLGDFDWREWGFVKPPSSAFLRGADDQRMLRETME